MLVLAARVSSPPEAKLDVGLDAETLTAILRAVIPPSISVPLAGAGTVTLRLDDFEVLGFDPGAGARGEGRVLAAVRVRVPKLSVDARVKPELSVGLADRQGPDVCNLNFEKVEIPVPVVGAVDIAPFLDPVVLPAENVSPIETSAGRFEVRSRLVDVRMGSRLLRFVFDLDVVPTKER